MQGVILDAMKRYSIASLGQNTWEQMLAKAGRSPTYEYLVDQVYSDVELGVLARNASEVSGKPATEVLEEFGEALVPFMYAYYRILVDIRWDYYDFLLNMESLLHSALRLHTPGALPTKVKAVRTGPHAVTIVYDSPMRACAAVRGIIRGAASKYKVAVEIVDERCVLRGDPDCVIMVKSLD